MLTIYLTDKGRELVSNLLPEHFCRTTSMMAQLTATEKKTFIELLGKLRSGTAAMREP
jgi:DNA-binding MarR family transcriptional regulator